MGLQDLQNDSALKLAGGLAGHFLQGNRPVQVDLDLGILRFANHQIVGDYVLAPQNDIALNHVFELADIARPMILAQKRHQIWR